MTAAAAAHRAGCLAGVVLAVAVAPAVVAVPGRAAAPATGGRAPAAVARAPTARLQVTALEFELRLSRQSVPAGPVRIELVDLGQDVHDLAVRRIGAAQDAARIPPASPGQVRAVTVALGRGRYRLRCTIADHARLGMWALLRVT